MHLEFLKSQSHHRKEVDRGLSPGYLLLCDFIQNLTLKVQYGRNCRLENSAAGCLDRGASGAEIIATEKSVSSFGAGFVQLELFVEVIKL